MITKHFTPLYTFRLGDKVYTAHDVRLARHVGEDDPPEPVDPDPVPPPPEPEPVPPPEPEPVPVPDDSPLPPPQPEVYKHDQMRFAGVLVLGSAEKVVSQQGRSWYRVTERLLNSWAPQSQAHLDLYLDREATHRRACFVFDLTQESPWFDLVLGYVCQRGGVALV